MHATIHQHLETARLAALMAELLARGVVAKAAAIMGVGK